MPLNYPAHLEGLLGLSEKYSQLMRPTLLPDFALSSGVAQAMKIANPYWEMQERLAALVPKHLDFSRISEANQYARSIAEQFQSLSALARPFAQSDLAALKKPLGDWAQAQQNLAALSNPLGDWMKVQRRFQDSASFQALQQQSSQIAALGKQMAQNFSGLQHMADWARTSNPVLSPASWSTQLLDWAGSFDATFAEFDAQTVDVAMQEDDAAIAPSMVAALTPLSEQLETLAVATAADVAALRAYLEELYTALVTATSLAIEQLLRQGKIAAASLLVFASSWGGFFTLLGVPLLIVSYIEKVDAWRNPEHAAATKEDLKQLKADIIDSIKQQAAAQGQLRTVARNLRVRVKPSEKSACLGIVEAGQQVVVLSTVGKRAYISYQDVDRLPMHGWVLKKYLGSAPRPTPPTK